MAETVLKVHKRTDTGSHKARQMRRRQLVPGVIYGHKEASIPVVVPVHAVWHLVQHGVRVTDVELDGQREKCLVREIQWDAFGKEILHIDLVRVRVDERVRVSVPLVLRGSAPGVAAGGILDQPLHTLEIECLAVELPENIRVPIGELHIGQAVHVRDLLLPPGARALADPATVVVQVIAPQAEVEKPAEAIAPAEPEVITRRPTEAEESQ